MANYSMESLALTSICPTNRLIADDTGTPGAYVTLAPQTLDKLLTNGDGSIVHPAFMVDGSQRDLYIGKFLGTRHNNRIYSLPGEDPVNSITLDNIETYCKNKGTGHHCTTFAEYAFLALWCKANKCQPYGNNNYGKDSRETTYVAIPTYADSNGRTCRTATGTGPLTWSHDGTLSGIWDLNGNTWEWAPGVRLVYGELQVIPYNNAASPNVSTAASSSAWKAINAAATSYADLFMTPNGSGTTSGSVKLDYVSSHWQWAITITDSSDSSRSAQFQNTTATAELSDFCKMYMRAMTLLPEDNDTDYESDGFFANNGAAERCAYRGGNWYDGALGGVFCLHFSNPRSNSSTSYGGRPAYYD
jgi:hypothetical protein